MTRILITGASGNVGREVVRASKGRNFEIRAAQRNARPDVPTTALDFADPSTWPSALSGIDAIFLLRPPALGDMRSTLIPFLVAARLAGVSHVVFLSVAGAEKMKWVPHHAVEEHLASASGRRTIIQPGFFAQNLTDAYRRDIAEDSRLYVPAGKGRVAFVDAYDIGDVVAAALAQPAAFDGFRLVLTGGAAFDFEEVAGLLSEVLERPIVYEAASVLGYAFHLWRRRLPLLQILVQCVLHVKLRGGDAEMTTDTIRNVLGREPTSLKQFIVRNREALSALPTRPTPR